MIRKSREDKRDRLDNRGKTKIKERNKGRKDKGREARRGEKKQKREDKED